jgi:hypothetical protein
VSSREATTGSGFSTAAAAVLLFLAVWLPAVPLGAAQRLSTRGMASALELQDGRFLIEVDWAAGGGGQGVAEVVTIAPGSNVELRSENSTIIEFFGNDNWELLLKVLDARGINQHFWVYLAAASSVGYDVTVVDTVCDQRRTYSGMRGVFQASTTDVTAFAEDCDSPEPPSCIPSDGVICLGNGRFRVDVVWQDFDDNIGIGRQVVIADGGPARSDDSGLFTFFDPNNWEMLVKVLDGCDVNGHFWVFNAATTDLAFTLSVTDTESGNRRRWSNTLGMAAAPFGRTSVFPCDPEEEVEEEPDPEPEDNGTFRLTGSGYANRKFTYTASSGNLVFCRPQNQRLIWIRLARDTQADGENGPHLDIDVCNYSGGGTFAPGSAPLNGSCSLGKQWDVFWHDGPNVFVNQESSAPCQLDMSQNGDVLQGTFRCSGMRRFQGDDLLDLTSGSFRCTIAP